MGHHEEWHAAGRLGSHALGGVVGAVRGVHHAVLTRVESLLPAPARPVTALHRGISGAVYFGVKDPRYGAVLEDDWSGHDPDGLLGDGMVRYSSAAGAGRTRRLPFDIDNGARVTGVGHLALLNHPAVYAQIRTWLAPKE